MFSFKYISDHTLISGQGQLHNMEVWPFFDRQHCFLLSPNPVNALTNITNKRSCYLVSV